jgi:hypothetical protein
MTKVQQLDASLWAKAPRDIAFPNRGCIVQYRRTSQNFADWRAIQNKIANSYTIEIIM